MNIALASMILGFCWFGDPPASKQELVTRIQNALDQVSSVSFTVDVRQESKYSYGPEGTPKPPKRRFQASVVMASGGRFRVEAFEDGRLFGVILCDGQDMVEWEGKENLWTRYAASTSGGKRTFRFLLVKDAAVSGFAACWLDKNSLWRGGLEQIVAMPEAKLGDRKRLKGRDCDVIVTETSEWQFPGKVTVRAESLYDSETHFPVRTTMKLDFSILVQSGKDYLKNTYRDVKFNESLSVDAFVFTPPEGSTFVPPDDPRFIKPSLDGKPAPEFSLSDLEGKPRTLAQARGSKATIVVFWATWCNPCKKEIPALVRLHGEFKDKGLAIIAVSEDKIASTVQSFIKAQGVPYLVLHDPKSEAGNAYLVDGIPHTVLIDKSGVIVKTWVGGGSDELEKEIREEITKLQAAGSAPTPPGARNAADVMTRAKEAIGHDAQRKWAVGVRVEGSLRSHDVDGKFHMFLGSSGKFVWRTEGRLPFTMGFDGGELWNVDWSNTPFVCEPGEECLLEEQVIVCWILGGHWLDTNAEVLVSPVEEASDDDRAVFSIKRKGRTKDPESEFWLAVDRASGRPTVICRPGMLKHPLYRLEDYRPVEGFYLPHRLIRFDETTDEELIVEDIVASSVIQGETENVYRLQANWKNDVRFDGSVSPRIRLKVTDSGHILVRPRIDGRSAGWFLLDSGCSNVVIDPAKAKQLELRALEDSTVEITEDGILTQKTTMLTMRRAEPFQLGPMVVSTIVMPEMPLTSLSKIDPDLAGLCGYDLFRRAVIELNLRKGALTIRDPDTYEGDGLDWVDFRYDGRGPIVRCTFEGNHEASFLVDTGSPTSVGIDHVTVERFRLLKGRETTLTPTAGPQKGLRFNRTGKLAWFQIGPHRLEDIADAEFDLVPTSDQEYDSEPSGLIGTGLLSQFKVVFDYPHKRIAFIRLRDNQDKDGLDRQDADEGD